MIILETVPEPQVGGMRITFDQWVDVQISAEQACETVGEWLFEEITMMMCAEPPTFIIGERSVWRVPVIFYATHVGRVGQVGTVDVDTITGDIVCTIEEAQAKLYPAAQALSKNLPPFKSFSPPEKYKSTRLPPAKVIDASEIW